MVLRAWGSGCGSVGRAVASESRILGSNPVFGQNVENATYIQSSLATQCWNLFFCWHCDTTSHLPPMNMAWMWYTVFMWSMICLAIFYFRCEGWEQITLSLTKLVTILLSPEIMLKFVYGIGSGFSVLGSWINVTPPKPCFKSAPRINLP